MRLVDDPRYTFLTDAEVRRIVDALDTIRGIAEGSRTVNSLPHIAKIAEAALGARPLNWADDFVAQVDAYKARRRAEPYGMCPSCGGNGFYVASGGVNVFCDECKGSGWRADPPLPS